MLEKLLVLTDAETTKTVGDKVGDAINQSNTWIQNNPVLFASIIIGSVALLVGVGLFLYSLAKNKRRYRR